MCRQLFEGRRDSGIRRIFFCLRYIQNDDHADEVVDGEC